MAAAEACRAFPTAAAAAAVKALFLPTNWKDAFMGNENYAVDFYQKMVGQKPTSKVTFWLVIAHDMGFICLPRFRNEQSSESFSPITYFKLPTAFLPETEVAVMIARQKKVGANNIR